MKKFLSKELKIALSVIISAIILYAGIQFLKGVNVMKPANHYYVTLNNVQDLMLSSPVTVDGFKVGLVYEMYYDYESNGKVKVMLNLDKELKIPQGSKVKLTRSIMGSATIVIEMNPYVSEYYKPGDTIEGEVEGDMLSGISAMLPKIEALMPKLDSILVGVQTIVNDPALISSVKRLDGITANLQETTSTLSKVMKNDVPQIINNVNSITCNVDSFTATLNKLPLESTLASANKLVGNLEKTTQQLNSTDNTLGLLLNDRYFYDRITGTIVSLDSLLIDIRTNPKRYINIKVF